ncbi:TetR/AcrR family transcriptional regulator [Phormidium tenue FACHB-886]|nr:TetR/AcrR family transcriptional regulator [Phormidium tenue FACHB-886]
MSKEAAIPKFMTVFRQYGYDGATLAMLSQATGLGKASLYHHFPKGKEEMAAAVLEYLDRGLTEQLLAPLHSDLPPVDRLRAMSERIDEFYQHGRQDCLLGLLSIGEARHLFQEPISRSLTVWIDSLARLAIEAGIAPDLAHQRAEDVVLQIQGALVLARGLNDSAPFERILKRLPEILLGVCR